ncbi:DUF535 family protein, partial [Salmonella enterica subsp. enterica serovar Anatum]|nr:DUF535 family protein [Salmonella enterica subsp. enterica serovar Anatum]
ELTLTLCFNDTPLARLSFSFIRHEGKQIALVAGLQGPSKHVGSVGATLAWLSAASGLCDGVVCYYGSRIRQYLHLAPLCPTLVI